MKTYFLPLFFLFSFSASAAILELRLNPNRLDSRSYQISSPHIVVWDDQVSSPQTLVINIGGTGSQTDQFLEFAKTAAEMGMPAFNVDYPNGVISTSCRTISPDCFDFYRREIVFGDQVSPIVNVNVPNSIYARIGTLLRYLKTKDSLRFGGFLDSKNNIQWKKIILTGHSQGSGHAAYLAKVFRVQGVIAFSGPHDHSAMGPASWIVSPGLTPSSKYFALLHTQDFFGFDGQLQAMRDLVGEQAPYEFVDGADLATLKAQIYATNAIVPDPHNSVLLPLFKSVWQNLLQRLEITANLSL